jgi:hypothetical protein
LRTRSGGSIAGGRRRFVKTGEILAVLKGKDQAEVLSALTEYEVLAASQELEAFTRPAAVETASAQWNLPVPKPNWITPGKIVNPEYRLTSDLTLNTITPITCWRKMNCAKPMTNSPA